LGAFYDDKYSARDYWFGFFERNPLHLWRDKYGFFDATPHLVTEIVFLAGVIALCVFVNYGIAWCLLTVGLVRFLYVLTKSVKDQKNQRVKQIAFLTNAATGIFPSGLGAGAIDNPNPAITKADRMFYKYIPWVYVQAGSALETLNGALQTYAQSTPQKDWFKGH
jgi:hypothetical protein